MRGLLLKGRRLFLSLFGQFGKARPPHVLLYDNGPIPMKLSWLLVSINYRCVYVQWDVLNHQGSQRRRRLTRLSCNARRYRPTTDTTDSRASPFVGMHEPWHERLFEKHAIHCQTLRSMELDCITSL
jgi:hypothetical protein